MSWLPSPLPWVRFGNICVVETRCLSAQHVIKTHQTPSVHAAAGVDLGQLLLQLLDHIYAAAYPLTVSERHADQQLARKTLQGGIIKRAFSGNNPTGLLSCTLLTIVVDNAELVAPCGADEELNTLYNDCLTNIVGKMLLMASPASEDTVSRPFHTVDAIVHSVRKLLEPYQGETIWAEVCPSYSSYGATAIYHERTVKTTELSVWQKH